MTTSLPPLYSGWMTELFGEGAEPDEPRATCMSCAMVDRPGQPPLELAFSAEAKCCTYHPSLPNFLVGQILGATDELGEWSRRLVRQRIRQRFAVTPAAVEKPPVYAALYALAADQAFGRARGLRCPYYVDRAGGLCGVWQHRTATCATWFCKHDRGMLGRLYARAVEALFKHVEHGLQYWVLREVGLPAENLAQLWSMESGDAGARNLDTDAMNGTVSNEAYRAMWGPAAGHEEELYAACAARVAPLTLADVRRICGFAIENTITVVEVLRRRLAIAPPERVRVSGAALVQIGKPGAPARVRLAGFMHDWLELPEALLRELERFERAPVRQVVAELAAEGIAIDEQLVRRLLDWNVLAPA